jgi:hypothetical protein
MRAHELQVYVGFGQLSSQISQRSDWAALAENLPFEVLKLRDRSVSVPYRDHSQLYGEQFATLCASFVSKSQLTSIRYFLHASVAYLALRWL